MSQAAHVSNINFSTAFLIDKICGITSNTFTAGAFNVGGFLYQTTIPHSFTRPVFCDGLFSANNSTFVPNGQNDGTNAYNVYSDSSNIYLLTSANSGTIYYKVVQTWIDNFDNTNPLITPVFNTTLPTTNSTNFDSRQNYQKIFDQKPITLNNPGVGNVGTYVISHPLGYNANYKIFFESLPGQVWPCFGSGNSEWLYNPSTQYICQGVMSPTALTVTYSGGSSSAANFRIWYRIYYQS